MQENNNYSGYVSYENHDGYGNNNPYVTNPQVNMMPNTYVAQSRNSELCFAFGIVSLCLLLGNPYAGLVFGILSLAFRKKSLKEGIQNRNTKDGYVMGLIGTILNGIYVAFCILVIAFYVFICVAALMSEL